LITCKQILLLVSLELVQISALAAGQCPPPGYGLPELFDIKRSGFVVGDDQERNALAIGLLACLANPDPAVRDGVVYEGIAHWLRDDSPSRRTIDSLFAGLMEQISAGPDSNGFRQPFAALILSEVARTDRMAETLTDAKREKLVEAAAGYLSGVRDYRGFSEAEGWRHGVAHGSDLVLQLVLNPHIDADQVQRLVAAVFSQVAPDGELFYHYGEPERLARATFYAWRRDVVGHSAWAEWFEAVSSPQPLEGWQASFSSQAGLAKRHNTLAFLLVMHLYATAAENEQGRYEELDNMVMQAIDRVTGG